MHTVGALADMEAPSPASQEIQHHGPRGSPVFPEFFFDLVPRGARSDLGGSRSTQTGAPPPWAAASPWHLGSHTSSSAAHAPPFPATTSTILQMTSFLSRGEWSQENSNFSNFTARSGSRLQPHFLSLALPRPCRLFLPPPPPPQEHPEDQFLVMKTKQDYGHPFISPLPLQLPNLNTRRHTS